MRAFVLVALGGALGAAARYAVGLAAARVVAATGLPLATWAVNLGGSFALGLLLAGAAQSGGVRLAVGVGFLGAFTTFSAYSAETLELLRAGRTGWAAANALGSVVLGLLCVAAGGRVARALGLSLGG